MTSSEAICWLVYPRATKPAISRCRGVRASRPGPVSCGVIEVLLGHVISLGQSLCNPASDEKMCNSWRCSHARALRYTYIKPEGTARRTYSDGLLNGELSPAGQPDEPVRP